MRDDFSNGEDFYNGRHPLKGRLPLLPPEDEHDDLSSIMGGPRREIKSAGRRDAAGLSRTSSNRPVSIYSTEGLDLYNTRQKGKIRLKKGRRRMGSGSSSTTSTALSSSSFVNLVVEQGENKRLAYFSPAATTVATEWFVRKKEKAVVVAPVEILQRDEPKGGIAESLVSTSSSSQSDNLTGGPLFNEFGTKRKVVEQHVAESHPPEELRSQEDMSPLGEAFPPVFESPPSPPAYDEDFIPYEYRAAAREEAIDPEHLRRFFESDGFLITRCFSAFRYRKDVIEEGRCCIRVSRDMPIYKFTNLTDGKSRLYLPDLQVEHTPAAQALDCFIDYQWPNGDRQLLDLKHTDGVMAQFRNAREPIYFVTPGDDQQLLMDCLTVVRRVARNRNLIKKSNFNKAFYSAPAVLPPPSVMYGRGRKKLLAKYPSHEKLEADFGVRLDEGTRRLVTTRAVGNYWKNEQQVWVSYWSARSDKYKRALLSVFVHPYGPDLVVSDSKGSPVSGILDLQAYSCSRINLINDTTIPLAVRHQRLAPHVTGVDCLGHNFRTFFSFETVELLKDFQQTVATLGYLQQLADESRMGYGSAVGSIYNN